MTIISSREPASDPCSCQYPTSGTGTVPACLPKGSDGYSYADTVSWAVEGVSQSVSNVTKSALSYLRSFYPPLPDANTIDFTYPRFGTMPVLPDQRLTQNVLGSYATSPFMEEVASSDSMCPIPTLADQSDPFFFQHSISGTTPYEPLSEENGLTISEAISQIDSETVRKYLPIWITSGAAVYNGYRFGKVCCKMDRDQYFPNRRIAAAAGAHGLVRDIDDKVKRHSLNLGVHTIRVLKPLTYLCPSPAMQKITREVCDLSADGISLYRHAGTRIPELDRNPTVRTWKDTAHTVFKSGVTALNLLGNAFFLAHSCGLMEGEDSYVTMKKIAFAGMLVDIAYEALQKANFFRKKKLLLT